MLEAPEPDARVQRIIAGEIFLIPAAEAHAVDYRFSPQGWVTVHDGLVGEPFDTGRCGSQAIAMWWTPLVKYMRTRFRAIHVGPTEEKARQLLVWASSKKRGRKSKRETRA